MLPALVIEARFSNRFRLGQYLCPKGIDLGQPPGRDRSIFARRNIINIRQCMRSADSDRPIWLTKSLQYLTKGQAVHNETLSQLCQPLPLHLSASITLAPDDTATVVLNGTHHYQLALATGAVIRSPN
jgi:hypothetical protein